MKTRLAERCIKLGTLRFELKFLRKKYASLGTIKLVR